MSATPTFPSRTEFEAWLRAHRPRQTIGRRAKIQQCPLACFLQERGFPCATVRFTRWGLTPRGETFAMPDWATKFREGVDNSPGDEMTARTAIRLLAGVEGP